MQTMKTRVDWETRDEGQGTGTEGGAAGLEEIRSAVEGFTATVEQRLGQLDTALAEIRSRQDRTETVLRRPGAGGAERRNEGVEGGIERRSFEN